MLRDHCRLLIYIRPLEPVDFSAASFLVKKHGTKMFITLFHNKLNASSSRNAVRPTGRWMCRQVSHRLTRLQSPAAASARLHPGRPPRQLPRPGLLRESAVARWDAAHSVPLPIPRGFRWPWQQRCRGKTSKQSHRCRKLSPYLSALVLLNVVATKRFEIVGHCDGSFVMQ